MESASYTVWYCCWYASDEVSTASRLSPSPDSSRSVSSRLTSAHMAGSSVLVTVPSAAVWLV